MDRCTAPACRGRGGAPPDAASRHAAGSSAALPEVALRTWSHPGVDSGAREGPVRPDANGVERLGEATVAGWVSCPSECADDFPAAASARGGPRADHRIEAPPPSPSARPRCCCSASRRRASCCSGRGRRRADHRGVEGNLGGRYAERGGRRAGRVGRRAARGAPSRPQARPRPARSRRPRPASTRQGRSRPAPQKRPRGTGARTRAADGRDGIGRGFAARPGAATAGVTAGPRSRPRTRAGARATARAAAPGRQLRRRRLTSG